MDNKRVAWYALDIGNASVHIGRTDVAGLEVFEQFNRELPEGKGCTERNDDRR